MLGAPVNEVAGAAVVAGIGDARGGAASDDCGNVELVEYAEVGGGMKLGCGCVTGARGVAAAAFGVPPRLCRVCEAMYGTPTEAPRSDAMIRGRGSINVLERSARLPKTQLVLEGAPATWW